MGIDILDVKEQVLESAEKSLLAMIENGYRISTKFLG